MSPIAVIVVWNLVVERSPGMREVGGSITGRQAKDVKNWGSAALIAKSERSTGRLGVRIMDIRDVVFQLVSTIAIGLRPGQHKTGPAHCSSRYMRLKKCQRDPKPCPLTRSLINCNIGDTL